MKSRSIRYVVGIMLVVAVGMYAGATPFPKEPPATPEVLEVLETAPFSGEPYELQGKRIVFTNWYLVRPGVLLWLDEKGKYVNMLTEPDYDPWEVQAERPSSPYGIEIVTQPATVREFLEPEYLLLSPSANSPQSAQPATTPRPASRSPSEPADLPRLLWHQAWNSCPPGGQSDHRRARQRGTKLHPWRSRASQI